jgi:hypothetical protein
MDFFSVLYGTQHISRGGNGYVSEKLITLDDDEYITKVFGTVSNDVKSQVLT